MRIRTTIHGGAGTAPVSREFEYAGCDDEVLAASVGRIRGSLQNGLRINFNEALLLFVDHAASSLRDGLEEEEIRTGAAGLLAHHNVMAGVPEMMGRLDLCIEEGGASRSVSLYQPIVPEAYAISGPPPRWRNAS